MSKCNCQSMDECDEREGCQLIAAQEAEGRQPHGEQFVEHEEDFNA